MTSDEIKSIVAEAERLDDREKFDKAIDLYNQLIEGGHGSAKVVALRGYSRFRKGDYEGAIKDFSEALSTKPSASTTWFFRARAKEHIGDLDGALFDYNESAKLDPTRADVFMNSGLIEKYRGHFEQARTYFKRAVEVDPQCTVALNSLREIERKLREA